jgi:hypothetical protein
MFYLCTSPSKTTLKQKFLNMSQTLFEKLLIQDERNLLIQGLPSSIEKQFTKLSFSKNVTPLLKSRKIDFALVFAVSESQLSGILREVLPALKTEAKLWIAYPKATSKIATNLNRNCSWDCITGSGYGACYEDLDKVELDNVWVASRFKKAKQLISPVVTGKARLRQVEKV